MNIILITADEITDGQVSLYDHRAVHIIKVLRTEPGERIRIGVIDGGRGLGVVTGIQKKRPCFVQLTVEVDDSIAMEPEMDLILAMPRPIMLQRILTQVAALGIGRIFLIHANRVEKSFWESGLLENHQYQAYFRQGLEQAIDTRMPHLEMHRRFKPFVEDFLPEITGGYQFHLLAHPYNQASLAEILTDGSGRILLAVGPEGGWVDFEVEMFRRQGFSCCSLGERILKVDTAVVALHSRVTAIREVLKSRTCS